MESTAPAAAEQPDGQKNGHAAAETTGPGPAAPAPAPAAPPNMKAARDFLDQRVEAVAVVFTQGILHSCPGIPPHEILNSICRTTGKMVAGSISADLSTLFQIRKGFKDAFDEGVKSAPLKQPGPNPQA